MSSSGVARIPARKVAPPGDEVVLLGVRFDLLARAQALSAMVTAFGRGEAWKIYFVNAHTLNLAWSDRSFRKVLNAAELVLNDGSGTQIASFLAGKPFPENLVGTDLTPQLCEHAAKRGIGVFLLGGSPGVPERAARKLRELIPDLIIAGFHHGYFSEAEEDTVVELVNGSRAGVLLVAFGNPLQENWIHRNAARLRCDVCLGVGGLFDHLSGRLRRAPRWMRRLGVEWIFILMWQPGKWKRYLIGNPLFVVRILMHRLGILR